MKEMALVMFSLSTYILKLSSNTECLQDWDSGLDDSDQQMVLLSLPRWFFFHCPDKLFCLACPAAV